MISLTKTEWEKCRDEWAKTKKPGTKVLVYGRTIVYSKKRSPIAVFGKFVLTEARTWVRE